MFKGLNEIMAPVRTCVSMLADIRNYRKYVSGNLEVRKLISGIGILIRVVKRVIVGSVDTQKIQEKRQEERQTDKKITPSVFLLTYKCL